MRLINTTTYQIEEFCGNDIPPYAILSHTWEQDEVNLQDFIRASKSTRRKKGYKKIMSTCKLAREAPGEGLKWAWVDTCCIDKTSSAELSEAINSMFQWYHNARVCYVWLWDLAAAKGKEEPGKVDGAELAKCRWFKRGWTLQELIAPRAIFFYDSEWKVRGNKGSLRGLLRDVTGIDEQVLRDSNHLANISIATRMFWASKRETSRIEDRAYSLLGILDVNMPLLYGERHRSFHRLQQEIIKQNTDLTILGWGHRLVSPQTVEPLDEIEDYPLRFVASSPSDFAISFGPLFQEFADMTIMATGAQVTVTLHAICDFTPSCTWMKCVCRGGRRHFLPFATQRSKTDFPGIHYGLELVQLGPDLFARTSRSVRTVEAFDLVKNEPLKVTRSIRLLLRRNTVEQRALDAKRLDNNYIFRTFAQSLGSLHNATMGEVLTSDASVVRAYPEERYNMAPQTWYLDWAPPPLQWGCVDAAMSWKGQTLFFGVAFSYAATARAARLFKKGRLGAKAEFTLTQLNSTAGSYDWDWAQRYFADELCPLREPGSARQQGLHDWNELEVDGKMIRVVVGAPDSSSLCIWLESVPG
jgi:hypothetical protein